MRTALTLIAVVLVATGAAWADPFGVAELVGPSGSPHMITVPYSTGDMAFSFNIEIETDFDATSAQMIIQGLDALDVFDLTGITFQNGWGDWGFPTDVTPSNPDPMNGSAGAWMSQLIGSLAVGEGTPTVPAGRHVFATVDAIVAAGTLPGTYYLNLTDIILGDLGMEVDILGTPGQALGVEVTAIPAPPAVLLGVLGLAVVNRYRRRQALPRVKTLCA